MPIEPPPPLDQNGSVRAPQPGQSVHKPTEPLTPEEMQQVLAVIRDVEAKETRGA